MRPFYFRKTTLALYMIPVLTLFIANNLHASQIPAGFYRIAASEGVPTRVLWSIALQETKVLTNKGRVIPWKYSLNHKGKSYYYRTKEELKGKAVSLLAEGETRFDIGIGQINYHWHWQEFNSLDEMIAPHSNLTYAARYLKSHYERTGDWWVAVGMYHSPANGTLAKAYSANVKRIWANL